MKRINIYKYHNIKVHFLNRKISLPQNYIKKIDKYWNLLQKQGKKFIRGDIFTIKSIKQNNTSLIIYVELTDYAHFLFTYYQKVSKKYDCRVIHTSALIETSDHKFVIGVMNNGTYAPQKLQFIGGGIDKDDLIGNELDLTHNIRKEISEELGLNTQNINIIKNFKPYLLKSGGETNFLSAVFKLNLLIDATELLNRFEKYTNRLISQKINPELSSLLLLKADAHSIKKFRYHDKREKDENLIPSLEAAVGLTHIKPFFNVI